MMKKCEQNVYQFRIRKYSQVPRQVRWEMSAETLARLSSYVLLRCSLESRRRLFCHFRLRTMPFNQPNKEIEVMTIEDVNDMRQIYTVGRSF